MRASPAERLLSSGRKWYAREKAQEALELFEAAQMTAAACGETEVEAYAWTESGRTSSLGCQPKVAEHAFGESARCFASLGAQNAARTAIVRQAFMAYDAGDSARSLELLDEVTRGSDVPPHAIGRADGYRANIARSRDRHEEAEQLYHAAITRLDAIGDDLYAATFRMDLAVAKLLQGDGAGAHRKLHEARAASPVPADPALSALVDHYEVLTFASLGEHQLLEEAVARFAPPRSKAMSFLAESHAFARALCQADADQLPALRDRLSALHARCPPYEHGRLTLRILRGLAGGGTAADERFVIAAQRHEARLGSNVAMSFGAASPEWRILLALVAALEGGGDGVLTADQLVEAGWPGERPTPKSARNRLHVALSNLRKRGLREVLLRHPTGYALSRVLTVIRAPASE